jgi:hypothetical protein
VALANPSDATEIFYGVSGDVRDEINAYAAVTTAGHYADQTELPGSLIIGGLRRATRLINIFLEPTYPNQLPFTATGDVPKFLDDVGTDIATYYTLRSVTAKLGRVSDEKKQDYFDHYVKSPDGLLVLIRDRKLQVPELTVHTPDQAQSTRKLGRHPVFDLDAPENWGVDPDLLSDISDGRS